MADPSLVNALAGRHVVVVGDLMLDEFARGDVRRISPEAPVPVLEVSTRELVLGGAANAAANVVSLGGRATMVGVLGDDASAAIVERLLSERGVASRSVRDPARPTTHKTRLVARGQQIVRIDTESREVPNEAVRKQLIVNAREALATADACILSDYAKGAISCELVEAVIDACRARELPIVADPKRSDLRFYAGTTVITPNTNELELAVGRGLHSDSDYAEAAAEVLPALGGAALLATRGAGGMTLYVAGEKAFHVRAHAQSVFDVTGAGDTVVATLAIALAAGGSMHDAVALASAAAGVAVSKMGTATVTPAELATAAREEAGGMNAAWRRRLPSIAVAILLAAAVLYVFPKTSRQPFVETAVWATILVASFSGWGWLVARLIAPRERVDLGLMASWGASAMAFAGGCLLVPSAMGRTSALVLVDIGLVGAVTGLFVDSACVHSRARVAVRVLRREPKLALVAALVLLALAIQCAGAISEWHTNPYDDDIAYLPFAKKMIDTGSFPEPFSFRRLSAMGGQTFFVAITLLRGGFRQAHTFDRAICVVMVVLLLAGHRVRGRRPSFLFLTGATLLFLTLQSIAINTASYFSGVVFFLALYRTVAWLGDKPRAAWKSALPLALVGAAACTLRQNFLPIPAVMLAVSYLFRFATAKGLPWRARLVEPSLALFLSGVALAPWMIAQWQSNYTFLYPVIGGTFNQALALESSGMTIVREIQMQVWVAIDGILEFKTLGLFLVAAAFVREQDTRKPLWSLLAGCAVGFVLLVHGLTQGDAGNIGRYAYGFLMAFALAAALQTGLTRWRGRLARPQVAAGIALFAIWLQLVFNRDSLYRTYSHQLANIDLVLHYPVRSTATDRREVRLYADLQDTVPAGARMAVLLDEPYYLNFARNPIWNLDMPGYASLAPGIPFFSNADALEAYFRRIGVRYVAFVDPRYSRYHYRREYWVEMIGSESEIWRNFAPYLIDFLDRMTEIQKRHHHLYDWRGLMAIDLEAPP